MTDHDWGPDPLFGPFLRIHERFEAVRIVSYYDEEFHAFVGPTAWRQEWDIPTLRELICAEPVDTMLDLGSGEGRLTDRMVSSGFAGHIVGVDGNDFAGGLYERRFAATPRVRFERADIVNDRLPSCDVAAMASVTVNSFGTVETLHRFFRNVYEALNRGGRLILLAYTLSSVENFRALGRAIDAVDHVDPVTGEQRLVWRGVDFNQQDLRQNYFIEYRTEGFPGVLGMLREHVWTSDDVAAAGRQVGFRVSTDSTAVIDEGGAKDWICDALVFRKPI